MNAKSILDTADKEVEEEGYHLRVHLADGRTLTGPASVVGEFLRIDTAPGQEEAEMKDFNYISPAHIVSFEIDP